jgi:hypothetical protein
MYHFEAKLLKHNEARRKLIDVNRVRATISGSIAAGVAVLHRLAELGRDPAERRRLEEFAAAVIAEFENGN